MAIDCGARIIGVNNRNLKDFTVDVQNSVHLRNLVQDDVILYLKSGLGNARGYPRCGITISA